ncbi:MAG TPA: hypothetical protein VKB93_01655 [Thermoanaerobaculia bacterium]|nr:hypothetical protein [Thermoanaerobaculia bacterium]
MSNVLVPDPVQQPAANRFTPDAQERMARLRAMAAEFPDASEPQTLTPGDIRLARYTSVAALEKAALFAEAAPGMGAPVTNVSELRDAIAFEMAYGGVRDEALALARSIEHAILRRKLKAAKSARGLFKIAKGYVTLDVGDPVRPHLDAMKRSFTRPRRRKLAAPTELKTTAQK